MPSAAWAFARRFAADAASAHDLPALTRFAAHGLVDLIGARAIGIALFDGLCDHACIAIVHPTAGIEMVQLPLDEFAPHETDGARRSAAALFARHGLEPLLTAPLVADGRSLGVLAIDMSGRALPDEIAYDLALLIADQLAAAASRAHQRERAARAERRVRELELLDQIRRAVTIPRQLADLFHHVVEQTADSFGYRRVSLYLLRGEALLLQHQVGHDALPPTISWRDDPLGQAVLSGQPMLRADRRAGPADPGSISSVCVPLRAGGIVCGVLNVERVGAPALSDDDLRLLTALAEQIEPAIEFGQLYDALETRRQHNVQVDKLRTLGELASGVAHDFNNLLSIIIGHVEVLESPGSPHFSRSRRAILQAAQDGARTVRRIQEFVRAQPEQHSTPVDLAELADDVLQLTRPRWRDVMQGSGSTITIRQELRGVPRMLGDAAELREVVTNLILNAVDAMPEGGTLTLATGADDDGVWLEVRDTGVGIAPEVLARIFEPFYTTKAQRGNGLGLAISRSIALRHGGNLSVESTLGAGSSFRLTLPVPGALPATAAPPTPQLEAQVTPLRVLLIDDDRGVRDMMMRLLTIDGHQVECARDGAEALSVFSPGAYDIICSDLGMPGMSGWELIARLRERDPQPVTALLTGWGAQIDQAEAQSRGVDFIVPKPVDMAMLRAALSAAGRRRAGVEM